MNLRLIQGGRGPLRETLVRGPPTVIRIAEARRDPRILRNTLDAARRVSRYRAERAAAPLDDHDPPSAGATR